MQEKINILNATKLLKSGYVLCSYHENIRFLFICENNEVKIHTSSYKVSMKINDFIDQFQTFSFYLIEDSSQDKEKVDEKKDIDYYMNIQAKQ